MLFRSFGMDPLARELIKSPMAGALYGVTYLDRMVGTYGLYGGLIAYNWGPENVKQKGADAAPAESKQYAERVLKRLGIDAEAAKMGTSIGGGAALVAGMGATPTGGQAEGGFQGFQPSRTAEPLQGPGVEQQSADRTMQRLASRLAIEVPAASIGGAAGAAVGGRLGPLGRAVGERAGEVLGTFGGSLAAENVDPTEHPWMTAGKSAAFVGGTGALSSGLAAGLRKLSGKPDEAGKFLAQMYQAAGKVPPVGAVLDSRFIQSAQSFGSGEFFLGPRIKKMLDDGYKLVTDNIDHYVKDFNTYYKSARVGLGEWDVAVAKYLGNNRLVTLDREAFDIVQNSMKETVKKGLDPAKHLDPDFVAVMKIAAANPNVKAIKTTVGSTEAIRNIIYEEARNAAKAEARGEAGFAGTKVSDMLFETADRVGQSMDGAVALAIQQGKFPADELVKAQAARQLWKTWIQGRLLEDTLTYPLAKAEAEGGAVTAGAIAGGLARITRLENKVGHPLLTAEVRGRVELYTQALKKLEDSGAESGFKLAVRANELVGINRALAAQGSGAVMAGAGMATANPLMTAGGTIAFLSPMAIAYTFTNKQAMGLLLRGMHLQPGTAAYARAGRELFSLYQAEGYIDPTRVALPGQPQQ